MAFILSHYPSISFHLARQYNNKLDDNVTNVFGAKFLSTLSPVDICLEDEGAETLSQQTEATISGGQEKSAQDKDGCPSATNAESGERKIWGMVSKAGEGVGRADNDRQFLYLNGRPVDLPKVIHGSCNTPFVPLFQTGAENMIHG